MKKAVIITAVWMVMWVFTVGHALNNPACRGEIVWGTYLPDTFNSGCAITTAFPFGWPFYWSWQLQR